MKVGVALTEIKSEPLKTSQPSYSAIKIGQEGVVESLQEKKLSQENIKATENKENYFFLSKSQKREDTPQAFLANKAEGDAPQLKTQISQSRKLEKIEGLEPEEDWNEEFLNQYIRVAEISSPEYKHQRESALTYLHKNLSKIDINYDEGALIILATQKNDIEMIKFLLEKGANQGLVDALGEAGKNGYKEATEILIKFLNEHNMDFRKLRGTTAHRNYDHIKALFDQQFKVTPPDLVKS
jgi:hypothetical protein